MQIRTFCHLLCLLMLLNTVKTFEAVSEPVASFVYGDRALHIWPCARNGPDTPPSLWCFRYDPLFLPVVDENNTVIFTTMKYGKKWRTSFSLTLDDPTVKALAFQEIKEIFKDVEGLRPGNVRPLSMKKIAVTFPHLSEVFPDVNLISVLTFYVQPNQFSVQFFSLTQEKALELEEALRSSEAHYEVESYTSVSSASTKDDNRTGLEFHGHQPLYPTNITSPSIVRRIQDIEKRLNKMSSEFHTTTSNFTNLLRDVTSTLLVVEENISHMKKGLCCQEGWRKFCDTKGKCHCYSYFSQAMSWEAARDKCRSYDSYLVSLHSSEENEYVTQLGPNNRKPKHARDEYSFVNYFWIGLHDRDIEGQFSWVDGSSVSYMNWHVGQPDGSANENCVINTDKIWSDSPCSASQPFVCKSAL